MVLKIKNSLLTILKVICFFCIVGLTFIVALQVMSRAFKISLPWCEELARFFLIWLTFAGCSVALSEDRHLSVSFFVDLTKGNINKFIVLFGELVIIIFYLIITIYGFKLSSKTMHVLSPTMQWPMGLVYSVLPITSLMTLYILVTKFFSFKKGEKL